MYTAGRKFKPSASMLNELDRVARDSRASALGADAGLSIRPSVTTVVWATNSSGTEIPRGGPAWLSISGSWQTTAMTPEQLGFTADTIPFTSFSSTPAIRTDPQYIQGIALDTGQTTKMFPVAIGGVAWAKVKLSIVNGTAPSIGVLDASDSDRFTHHGRDAFGPHRIIKTAASDSAMVLVNAGMLSVCIGRVGTSAIASGAFGDVWNGAATNTTTTNRQLFKVKNPGSTSAPANATVAIARDCITGELSIISEYC